MLKDWKLCQKASSCRHIVVGSVGSQHDYCKEVSQLANILLILIICPSL